MLPFKKILVPIDFSFSAAHALRAAVAMRELSGGEITTLNAVEPLNVVPFYPGFDVSDYPARAAEAAKAELGKLAKETLPLLGDVDSIVRLGRPADAIVELAEERGTDLIVMGTHGRRGPRRLLIGSVAEEVLRRSSCPVLTVHEHGPAEGDPPKDARSCLPVKTILAPTDFSDVSLYGVDLALAIGAELDAEVHVLHVVDQRGGDALEPMLGDQRPNVRNLLDQAKEHAHEMLAKEVAKLGEKASAVKTGEHVVLGHPAKEIASFAKGYAADLIVMGSRGRSGLSDYFTGSTAERVVRMAGCPILTLHGPAESGGKRTGEPK